MGVLYAGYMVLLCDKMANLHDTSNICPKTCNDAYSILKLLKLLYADDMVGQLDCYSHCGIV